MKKQLLTLANFAVLFACSDAVGPAVITGGYSLRSAGQVQLPYLLQATATCDNWLISGHLVISSSNEAVLELGTDLDCTAVGGTRDTTISTYTGTVVVEGQTITFASLPLGPGTYEPAGGLTQAIRVPLAAPLPVAGSAVFYFGRDASLQ